MAYIYDGENWQILITIDDIVRLSVIRPDKTGYAKGFPFTSAGLIVTAHYTDGSVATIHTGYTLYWDDLPLNDGNTAITAEIGSKVITVNWRGRAVFFTISVFEADIMPVTNTDEWLAALNFIQDGDDNDYVINVSGNIGVPGSVGSSFGSRSGISVLLQGDGRLYLTSQGHLITINQHQTLHINGADLILEGLTNEQNGATENNNVSLVLINGHMELLNGTISGNYKERSGGQGGGVVIHHGGSFTMTGGTISGNNAQTSDGQEDGGGVFVSNGSSFIMTGGIIKNNSTGRFGGGVSVYGNFSKSGGIIYGNDAQDENDRNVSSRFNEGHAVYFRNINNGRGFSRDTTLYETDNLNTSDPLPANPGETLNGWTRRR
jgi:hypothetical protein